MPYKAMRWPERLSTAGQSTLSVVSSLFINAAGQLSSLFVESTFAQPLQPETTPRWSNPILSACLSSAVFSL